MGYAVHLIHTSFDDCDPDPAHMHMASTALGFKPTSFPHKLHYKEDAIKFAREVCDKLERMPTSQSIWCQVVNTRTNQATHMLPSQKSSCRVCGNELEGKLHCPLCGALHSYK